MKTFWIPGLISLAAIELIWTAIGLLRLPPAFVNIGFATIPIIWQLIVVLPLIGAIGAYVSLRFGGSRWDRLGAGLFSALPLVVAYPLGRLVGLFIHITNNTAPPTLSLGEVFLLMAMALPVLMGALFLGTLPFLRVSRRSGLRDINQAQAPL